VTDERTPAGEEHLNPPPEVDGEDPTVVYVPIQDRTEHPMTREEASSLEGVTGYALIVERGPRTGMTYLLAEGNTTVGRHPERDINDVTVSRQHCRFVADDDGLMVEDSGSTNGTYVNDARVDQATLKAGDEVLVGRFHFVVAHGDDR
jgi:translation elongation factor EF-G